MNNPFETINSRLSNIESLLLDLKHGTTKPQPTPQPENPQYLIVKESNKTFAEMAEIFLKDLEEKGW